MICLPQSQLERNKSKIHQKLGLINTFFLCAGGHYSSLLIFCLLRDWPTISEPWKGLQRPQNRHVHPCFHPPAILFLHWLAKGKTTWSCLALNKNMKTQFHLHAVGRGADYQSVWWGRWRLWNQPADWQKHSGWLHCTSFQHKQSEQTSAICCHFKWVCPLP